MTDPVKPSKNNQKSIDAPELEAPDFIPINKNVKLPEKLNNYWILNSFQTEGQVLAVRQSDNTLISRYVDNIKDKLSFLLNPGERVIIPSSIKVKVPDDCIPTVQILFELFFDYNLTAHIDINQDNTINIIIINNGKGRVCIQNNQPLIQLYFSHVLSTMTNKTFY